MADLPREPGESIVDACPPRPAVEHMPTGFARLLAKKVTPCCSVTSVCRAPLPVRRKNSVPNRTDRSLLRELSGGPLVIAFSPCSSRFSRPSCAHSVLSSDRAPNSSWKMSCFASRSSFCNVPCQSPASGLKIGSCSLLPLAFSARCSRRSPSCSPEPLSAGIVLSGA